MAREPRTPPTPQAGAVSGSGDGPAATRGTPASPGLDPRSVTTAGQTLATASGVDSVNPSPGMNATWGPVPVMNEGMTFREVGQTGLRQFSGWVREEFLQVLTGRQGAQKYREMMDNSATIGGLLFAIQSTMKKVEWRVQPDEDAGAGAGQEDCDFLQSCMDDMSSDWNTTIGEVLSMLPFGFHFAEIVYKKRLGRTPGIDPSKPWDDLPSSNYEDGKIGWRRLPGRSQDTIIKWFFDENGTTKGVTQQPWVGPIIDIPIEKGLLFRPLHYKQNPEGRSILRNSYVSYYYAKRLQEQQAIFYERMGGVPVIKIPGQILEAAQADPQAKAAVDAYKRIVVNLRTDEQMGVLLPSDVYPNAQGAAGAAEMYKFELVTPGSVGRGGLNYDATITRLNTQIFTSVLADFLTLGHEARGTQSLAVSKIDMFFQAIEGYLNSIAEIFNRFAIPRLWALNGMDMASMPKIEPDLAQRVDLDVLSNFILRMAQAGMPLFPDEDLQSYIKDAAGLPDVDDSLALQAAGLTEDQLDRQDEMKDTQLDQLQNPEKYQPAGPPKGSPRDNLEKMILKGYAQRKIRMAGPHYGIVTKRGKRLSGRGLRRLKNRLPLDARAI